jgi:hypothetical protein
MHPAIIVWAAGGAGVFGAASAALITRQIGRRRLRPQLIAMREHLASCTNDTGRQDQTAMLATPGPCVRDIAEGLAALDERRRQIANANPGLAAVLAAIESQAAWTAVASLAEEAEGL